MAAEIINTINDLISDPVTCQSLIGSKTVVVLENNKELSGYLASFDPVSGCLILRTAGEDKHRLIMSHSVVQLSVKTDDRIEINAIQTQSMCSNFSEEEIEGRRSKIMKLITEARLTSCVQSDGSIQVSSVAIIKPPFTPNDIVTTNSTVLSRIKELIQE